MATTSNLSASSTQTPILPATLLPSSGTKRPLDSHPTRSIDLPIELIRRTLSYLTAEQLEKVGPLNRYWSGILPNLRKQTEIKSFISFLIDYFVLPPTEEAIQSVNQALAEMSLNPSLSRSLSKCRQLVNPVVNLISIQSLLAAPWKSSSDQYWLILSLVSRNLTDEEWGSLYILANSIADASYRKQALLALNGQKLFHAGVWPQCTSLEKLKEDSKNFMNLPINLPQLEEKEFRKYSQRYFSVFQIHHWRERGGFIHSQVDEALLILDKIPDPYMRFSLLDNLFRNADCGEGDDIVVAYIRMFATAPVSAFTQLSKGKAPIQYQFTSNEVDKIIIQIGDIPLPLCQIRLISSLRCLKAVMLSGNQQAQLTLLIDRILHEITNPLFDPNHRTDLLTLLDMQKEALSTESQKAQREKLK